MKPFSLNESQDFCKGARHNEDASLADLLPSQPVDLVDSSADGR
jgi:hypothetical protein